MTGEPGAEQAGELTPTAGQGDVAGKPGPPNPIDKAASMLRKDSAVSAAG